MVSSINGNDPARRPSKAAGPKARAKSAATVADSGAARLRGGASERVQARVRQRMLGLAGDAARQIALPRLLVEATLAEQFGPAVMLEPGFQQLVDEVTAALNSSELLQEDLALVRRTLG